MSYTKFSSNLFRLRSAYLNELTEVYRPSLQRQGEKVVDALKKKANQIKRSELGQKMRIAKGYYRLEMSPPKIDEINQLKEDISLAKEFIQNGCYKYLTVRQAWLLFLVGLEVGLWFFLGETIGKFHIVGYKV